MNFLLKKTGNLHAEALEPKVTFGPPGATLQATWEKLAKESEAPFFLSWSWIGTWLRLLPPDLSPQVIEIRDDSGVCGLGVVISAKKQARFRKVPALYLHATGIPEIDRVYIELNGLLLSKGKEDLAIKALFKSLLSHPSGTCFYCPGVESKNSLLCARGSEYQMICEDLPSPYVDLEALGSIETPLIELLKKSTSRHIKKNLEHYSRAGDLRLTRAQTATEALTFFEGLKTLHQERFSSKNEEGAFSSPFFDEFHRTLISSHYASGSIDLIQIRSGKEAIGYLYLFIDNERVFFYQSGFHYLESTQPGLLSHYLAIDYYRSQNMKRYDFLAGEAQYKRAFANAEYTMRWATFIKDSPLLRLEQKLFGFLKKFRRS